MTRKLDLHFTIEVEDDDYDYAIDIDGRAEAWGDSIISHDGVLVVTGPEVNRSFRDRLVAAGIGAALDDAYDYRLGESASSPDDPDLDPEDKRGCERAQHLRLLLELPGGKALRINPGA